MTEQVTKDQEVSASATHGGVAQSVNVQSTLSNLVLVGAMLLSFGTILIARNDNSSLTRQLLSEERELGKAQADAENATKLANNAKGEAEVSSLYLNELKSCMKTKECDTKKLIEIVNSFPEEKPK